MTGCDVKEAPDLRHATAHPEHTRAPGTGPRARWPQAVHVLCGRPFPSPHQVAPCHSGLHQDGTFLESPSETALDPPFSSNPPLYVRQGTYDLVRPCTCLPVCFLSLRPQCPSTSTRGLCSPAVALRCLCLAPRKCSLGPYCLSEGWGEECEMTVFLDGRWRADGHVSNRCVLWLCDLPLCKLCHSGTDSRPSCHGDPLLAFRNCEFNQRQTKEGINKKPFFFVSCVPPTSDLSEKTAKSLFLLTYQLCSKPHKH